ncbi:MAG: hypothetical protein WD669_10170 [Pirellulales bacterium]
MLLTLICSVPVKAQALAAAPAGRTVGSVLGKAVTAAGIGLTGPIDTSVKFNATDKARWELLGRIAKEFSQPVVERFVKQQKIDATADELAKVTAALRKANERSLGESESRLAKVVAALSAPDLPAAERFKLEEERAQIERSLPLLRETAKAAVPEAMARHLIVAWKTERELHRKYGGRVIFQQFGAEALDGRRRLHEEAEKNGDLPFADAGVRHMFYYYANMKHTAVPPEALERPWFMQGQQ